MCFKTSLLSRYTSSSRMGLCSFVANIINNKRKKERMKIILILLLLLIISYIIHIITYKKIHKFRILEDDGKFTLEGKNNYVFFWTDDLKITFNDIIVRNKDSDELSVIYRKNIKGAMEIVDKHFETIKKRRLKKYHYINKN